MKKLGFLALACTLAGPVLAGGPTAPVKDAPVAAPAPAASYDWTGFYAGLSLGTGNVSDNGGLTDRDTSSVGLQIGYLRDLGTFVWGGELAYAVADIDDSDVDLNATRVKLIGGYDAGRVLPYAFVGLSQLEFDGAGASDTATIYGVGATLAVTPAIGVGLEYLVEDKSNFDGLPFDVEHREIALRLNYRF